MPGRIITVGRTMPAAVIRPPLKRMFLVTFAVLLCTALWIYSTRASMYALEPTPGHRLVYYVESSSGCIMLLTLWDIRSMDALPLEGDLHGPLTPLYRWAFFGHEDGTKLKPFQVFTNIQSSSSAFGFTLPYWLFITAAIGYGGFTLRRWQRRLAQATNEKSAPEIISAA